MRSALPASSSSFSSALHHRHRPQNQQHHHHLHQQLWNPRFFSTTEPEIEKKKHISPIFNPWAQKIPGKATHDATLNYYESYFNSLALEPFSINRSNKSKNKKEENDFVVSPFGFGGYRITDSDPSHQFALQQALRNGINFIDTSSNYENGGSERLIGTVLTGLIADSKSLSRSSIIVSTKAGYLQNDNLARILNILSSSSSFEQAKKDWGVCGISKNHAHSISPTFLADQLTQSCTRLNVESIDLMFLHNPEYVLLHHLVKAGAGNEPAAYDLFDDEIGRAFAFLEEQVAKGVVQHYAVSSNAFVPGSSSAQHMHPHLNISIDRLVEIAEKIGGSNHHFRAIQFPLNIHEAEAATVPLLLNSNNNNNNNSSNSATLIERATQLGLYTFSNRPFNAILGGTEVFRFARFGNFEFGNQKISKNWLLNQRPEHEEEENNEQQTQPQPQTQPQQQQQQQEEEELKKTNQEESKYVELEFIAALTAALERCISLEKSVPWGLSGDVPQGDSKLPHRHSLSWGQIISTNLDQFDSYFKWKDTLRDRIQPELAHALDMLRVHRLGKNYDRWISNYKFATMQLFQVMNRFVEWKHFTELRKSIEAMESISPSLSNSKEVSQKVLRVLRSSGVNTVLVGMRNEHYVKEILEEEAITPISKEEAMKILKSPETKIQKIEIVPEGELLAE